jgi:hypothetical protein
VEEAFEAAQAEQRTKGVTLSAEKQQEYNRLKQEVRHHAICALTRHSYRTIEHSFEFDHNSGEFLICLPGRVVSQLRLPCPGGRQVLQGQGRVADAQAAERGGRGAYCRWPLVRHTFDETVLHIKLRIDCGEEEYASLAPSGKGDDDCGSGQAQTAALQREMDMHGQTIEQAAMQMQQQVGRQLG